MQKQYLEMANSVGTHQHAPGAIDVPNAPLYHFEGQHHPMHHSMDMGMAMVPYTDSSMGVNPLNQPHQQLYASQLGVPQTPYAPATYYPGGGGRY